jgi:hypothetical protein
VVSSFGTWVGPCGPCAEPGGQPQRENGALDSPEGVYSVVLLGAKTEIPVKWISNPLHGVFPVQIKGYMDSIDIKHVSGWAIDFEHPDEILYVKVMLGEQLLGIIPANLYRDDLLKAGIPRANCMFLFRFPRQVPASQLLQVKVIPADSGCPLAGSLTDFQSYCAGRFFPYYRVFEYTWWDIECFEEEADSFLLTGDINLPDGSSEPRFVIMGYLLDSGDPKMLYSSRWRIIRGI